MDRKANRPIKNRSGNSSISFNKGKKYFFHGVPMLTRGSDTNLMTWLKSLEQGLLIEYGDLSRFVSLDEHYVPEEVEYKNEELGNKADPHGLRLAEIKAARAERTKYITALRQKWTPCYATIKALLTLDVEEAIKEMDGFAEAEETYDPLLLLRLCKRVASGEGAGEDPKETARLARRAYADIKKLPQESLAEFHERFSFIADQLNSAMAREETNESGEITSRAFLEEDELAQDFLHALDDSHEGFRNMVINNAATKAADMPNSLAKMYALACAYKGENTKISKSSRTIFSAQRKHHSKTSNDGKKMSTTSEISNIQCFTCSEYGHYARNCPNKNITEEKPGYNNKLVNHSSKCNRTPSYGLTLQAFNTNTENVHFNNNVVILDGGANASRFKNAKLLKYVGVDNTQDDVIAVGGRILKCNKSGYLPGFFRVGFSDEFNVNIISLHEVEKNSRGKLQTRQTLCHKK